MLAGSRYKVAKVLIISTVIVNLLTVEARQVLSTVDFLSGRAGVLCKNHDELINYTVRVSG
jgi:hypothetical protein